MSVSLRSYKSVMPIYKQQLKTNENRFKVNSFVAK